MPTYEISAPDGKTYRIDGPDGATDEQVRAEVLRQFPDAGSAPKRSALESAGRGVGLSARGLVQNVLGIPNLALDYGIGLGNEISKVAGEYGVGNGGQMPSASALTQAALTKLGLPEPQTTGEAIGTDVVGAMGGAPAVAKAMRTLYARLAPGVEREVVKTLGQAPGMQAAGAGAGVAASDAAMAAGLDPTLAMMVGLPASMVPGLAMAGGAAGTRGTLRGGEQGRQTLNERVQTFKDAGVDRLSAGQAAGTRVGQGIDSTLSKVPGGAGVMAGLAKEEAQSIGNHVNQLADNLVPNADAARAGRSIDKGFKNFLSRFKAEQEFLYGKVDRMIDPQSRVDIENTKQALADLNADIPGAPNTSEFFKNAKIKGIEGAVRADTESPEGVLSRVPSIQQTVLKAAVESGAMTKNDVNALLAEFADGKLPYEAVRKLRTLVGNELEGGGLASDVPRSKWKALYAALSQDLEGAAAAAGPDAQKAFARANWYTRAGHDRIEGILDRVSGKATAEQIFNAAVNPSETRAGATTINAVMRSLTPEERKPVTAALINRLGIATSSNQTAEGGKFSTETFLTNWDKISPEARMVLFPDKDTRFGLEAAAKAAEYMRDGSKVFANPSGTAAGGASIAVGAGAVVNPAMIPKIAMGIATAYGGARLMTNPNFIRWLGRTTRFSDGMSPAAIHALRSESSRWSEAERQDVEAFLRGLEGQP